MAREPSFHPIELPRPSGVPPAATARALRVAPELAGLRLDVFLSVSLRHTSRTRAKLIAKHAAFSVEGQRCKPNQRVKPEEIIVLWRVPVDEIDDSVALPELYRDEHLLVVSKPPNLAVHPTASHYHATVTKLLERRLGAKQHISLVHRLDKDTSGILLVALTPEADRAFKMLLEGTLAIPQGVNSEIIKTYQALTWGVPEAGLIDLPLERDPHNSLRVKMRLAPKGRGLVAKTWVDVEETTAGYARVRCRLLTGRQHQIRVHLAARGTPVVGDKLYGPDERLHAKAADQKLQAEDLRLLEMPRQALHAASYELPHAITWDRLVLHAPFPDDMQAFWKRVSGSSNLHASSSEK